MAMGKTCPTCGAIWQDGVQIPEPRRYKVAQRCPVCGGSGLVPPGYYNQMIVATGAVAIMADPCRSCGGTGIVFG